MSLNADQRGMLTSSVTIGAISPVLVKAAIEAACRALVIDPALAFESEGRRARVLAGSALKAVTRMTAVALAEPLKISNNELAPSLLQRAAITTDMMLEVVEALGGFAGAKAMGEMEREVEAEILAAPAPAERVERVVFDAPVAAKLNAPVAVKRGGAGWRARANCTVVAPVAAPRISPSKLRPVSGRVARFAGWFIAAAWDLDEVADLFGVNPDALTDALADRALAA